MVRPRLGAFPSWGAAACILQGIAITMRDDGVVNTLTCHVQEIKTATLQLRIKPSVKEAAQKAADADGRTLSAWIERVIEAAAKAKR